MVDYEQRGKDERNYRLTVSMGKRLDGSKIRERKHIVVEDESILKSPTKLEEYLNQEWYRFKDEVEANAYVSPDKTILVRFIDLWKELYASDPDNLSPATYKNYLVVIESRMIPNFGHLRVDQIETMQLAKYFRDLQKPGTRIIKKTDKPLTAKQIEKNNKPLDADTIVYIYRVFKNVFSRAVDWKTIKINPMEGVSKPTPKDARTKMIAQKANPQYYNEDEAQLIVDALYKESIKWRLLILGSMIGGCRRGELIGLEWPNVMFDENIINIENNIPLSEKGEAIEKGPKSYASYRETDMPTWYMEEMTIYKDAWENEKDHLGDTWQGGDREFVFHNGKGKPYYYQHPSKWWSRFCKRHGIRYIKFHGLRHSTGTLMLEDEDESNFDSVLMAIQKRLGHSRYSTTTDIYVHVTKKVKKRTTGKFDKFSRPHKETNEQPSKIRRIK